MAELAEPAAAALGLKPKGALGLKMPFQSAAAQLKTDPQYQAEQARIAQDRTKLDEAQGKYQSGIDPLKADLAAGTKEIEGMKFEPPAMPAEFKAKPPDAKEQQEFLSSMFMFAAIGGLMTRAPMTTALNSMSAAMEGLHAGNREVYERSFKEFQTNFKVAQEKSREYTDRFRVVMDQKKTSLAEKMNQIKMLDMEFQHTTGMLHHDLQDARGLITQMQNVARAQDQADKSYRQAEMHHQQTMSRFAEQERHNRVMEGQAERRMDLQRELPTIRAKAQQETAAAKAKAAGGKPMSSIQATMYEDVATGYYRLGKLDEMAKQTGQPPGGSLFLQKEEKVDGLVSAVKNYGLNNILPPGAQQTDALLLGIAFDVASSRSGGRGQLSDSKIREVTKQMPLESDDPSTRKLKYDLIRNQLEAANHTLPPQYQYDPVKGGMKEVAAAGAQPYDDAEKERRYQEWKAKQGAQ